jgi:hypothetical protein
MMNAKKDCSHVTCKYYMLQVNTQATINKSLHTINKESNSPKYLNMVNNENRQIGTGKHVY